MQIEKNKAKYKISDFFIQAYFPANGNVKKEKQNLFTMQKLKKA